MSTNANRQDKMDAALKDSQKKSATTRRWLALVVTIAAIGGIIVAITVGNGVLSQSKVSESDSAPLGVSASNGVNPYPSVSLKPNAPKVTIFTDMQCPVCAALERENGELIEKMAKSGDISLTSFPMVFLDRNFSQGDHGSSNTATNAALCAADEGKYYEYSKEMFKRQPSNEPEGFPSNSYKEAAAAVGLPSDKFNACFDPRKYNKFVLALDDKATELNTQNGTPAMMINGKFVSSQDVYELYSTPNSFEGVLKKYL